MLVLPIPYQVKFMPRDERYLDTEGFYVYKDSSLSKAKNVKAKDDETLLIRHLINYGKHCVSKHGAYKHKKVRIVISKPDIDKDLFRPDRSYSYLEDPTYLGYVERGTEVLDVWLVYFVLIADQIKKQNRMSTFKGKYNA